MLMELKAVTEALGYDEEKQHKRAIIVSDSMNTFQKHTERKPIYGLGVHHFWQLPKAPYLGILSETRS